MLTWGSRDLVFSLDSILASPIKDHYTDPLSQGGRWRTLHVPTTTASATDRSAVGKRQRACTSPRRNSLSTLTRNGGSESLREPKRLPVQKKGSVTRTKRVVAESTTQETTGRGGPISTSYISSGCKRVQGATLEENQSC